MKLLASSALAAVAIAAGSAYAMDNMQHGMGMGMDMKKMDANGDGMISKSEYMKYHEAMWKAMKKDKHGMVSMRDMDPMMGSGMMARDRTMGQDNMGHDNNMMTKDKTEGR